MTELEELQVKLHRCLSILNRDRTLSLTQALALSFGGTTTKSGLADVDRAVAKSIVECIPAFYLKKLARENRQFNITVFEKDPMIQRSDFFTVIQNAVKILPMIHASLQAKELQKG